MEKCFVFIDGGYIDALLKKWDNLPLDYIKFSKKMCNDLNLESIRTYYYNCLPIIRRMYKFNCSDCGQEAEVPFKANNRKLFCDFCLEKKNMDKSKLKFSAEQTDFDQKLFDNKESFFNKLKLLQRFEVKYGQLQLIRGEFKQKGVDVLMSLDIVEKSITHQAPHIVIVAGDADFIPAIRSAKAAGAIVHLYCSRNGVNRELLYEVDEVHNLSLTYLDNLRISTQ